MPDLAPPDGFNRHFRRSGLTDPWEPLYSRRIDGTVRIGLRAATAHANGRGFVHGGLIAALADNAMGLSCGEQLRAKAGGDAVSLLTVSLTLDFLGTAQVGQWLEIRPSVLKAGHRLCFAQALVLADEAPCARANATFVPALRGPGGARQNDRQEEPR
jgi:acyl-coenzyme A thioesterase PaaI-like protein